jgi:hypothetical protein
MWRMGRVILTVVPGGLESIGRQLSLLAQSSVTERISRARDMSVVAVRLSWVTGFLRATGCKDPRLPGCGLVAPQDPRHCGG